MIYCLNILDSSKVFFVVFLQLLQLNKCNISYYCLYDISDEQTWETSYNKTWFYFKLFPPQEFWFHAMPCNYTTALLAILKCQAQLCSLLSQNMFYTHFV